MQRPEDIRIVVKLRMKNRWAHPGPRRQMRDDVELIRVKQRSDRGVFSKIDMMHGNVLGNGGNVLALDLRIVKIVEVIENGDVMAVCE